MKPQPLSPLFRLLDYLMMPIMWAISLAPLERPQESHHWHAQALGLTVIESIDTEMTISLRGNDSSHVIEGKGPMFHIPFLGGWRNYVVFEIQSDSPKWHVGWVVRDKSTNKILRADLHKLPLIDRRVRLLLGTPARVTMFFAVDSNGHQLPLKIVGFGRMGDGSSFKNIRLL